MTHLGQLFGLVNSSLIQRCLVHDNCFTTTSTKVGLIADGFSHLARVSYDTSAANMLDMQYVWQHIIRLLMMIFNNLKKQNYD